jgi:PAS domain S-box-containing protein
MASISLTGLSHGEQGLEQNQGWMVRQPCCFTPDQPLAIALTQLRQVPKPKATHAGAVQQWHCRRRCGVVVSTDNGGSPTYGLITSDRILDVLAEGADLHTLTVGDVAVPTEPLPLSALDGGPEGYLGHREGCCPVVDATGQVVGMVNLSVWLGQRDRDALRQAQAQTARVQGELDLLESILEVILAGYWDWNLQTGEEYLSPRFKAMLGYGDSELANTPESWQNLIFSEDLVKVLSNFDRHVASQGCEPFYNEVRYRHKDGSTVWVICSGRVIEWTPEGLPQRMIGCHIDITQRKQAEESLQVARQELERFFDLDLDLLCIADVEGRFRRVNLAWERILGYAAADLEGQRFIDFVHLDDVEPTLAALAQLGQDQAVRGLVNRYRHRDGTYRYIEWYSRPYGDLIYAAARDVSDRIQYEHALQRNAAHLRAAQRISQMGSWAFTLSTGEVYWSQEVFRIFGLDPAQGPPDYDTVIQLYHPEDQPIHIQKVEEAIQTAQPYDLELRAYRPRGELVYIQARGEPVLDGEGQLVQLIGTVLDITHRKRAEQTLLRTTQQLQASNKELEAFAYSVSHDLRAPLRAINGFSRALLEDYGDRFDDQAQDYFNRIQRNATRMGDLIEDLLHLSRVSRSPMCYTTVDLSALVTQQLAELQMETPDRQVTAAIAPSLTVQADPTLMGVVLNNLIQNAWKFTQHRPVAHIEFGQMLDAPTDQSIFFVKDDGAGFDMAYSNKLFGVFQRLHGMEEFPGTGIGLATVQRAIHRHGGRVWAEGAVDQGATFFFTLPTPEAADRQ